MMVVVDEAPEGPKTRRQKHDVGTGQSGKLSIYLREKD